MPGRLDSTGLWPFSPVIRTGSEELLVSTSQEKFPIDWSADGRFLLYDNLDPKRGFDIWALPLEGDHKEPFPVLQTDFDEGLAQYVVTPDGQSFVLHSVVGETDSSAITVILNWKPKR